MSNTVIVIPSKRKPPIITLSSYEIPEDLDVIIVTDPDVEHLHREFYEMDHRIRVFPGARGLGANKALCYNVAFECKFSYFFRMDDDLEPKTFISKDGRYPDLQEIIIRAANCLTDTNTTLVGFHNGANRSWMSEGYGRTYGLVHGGATFSISAPDGTKYIDPRLVRAEDVYRTCAHREERDGFVGRVKDIGFDKSKSTSIAGQSSVSTTPEQVMESMNIVLSRFPNMVTCDGTREIFGGKFEIANWRMRKGV